MKTKQSMSWTAKILLIDTYFHNFRLCYFHTLARVRITPTFYNGKSGHARYDFKAFAIPHTSIDQYTPLNFEIRYNIKKKYNSQLKYVHLLS